MGLFSELSGLLHCLVKQDTKQSRDYFLVQTNQLTSLMVSPILAGESVT